LSESRSKIHISIKQPDSPSGNKSFSFIPVENIISKSNKSWLDFCIHSPGSNPENMRFVKYFLSFLLTPAQYGKVALMQEGCSLMTLFLSAQIWSFGDKIFSAALLSDLTFCYDSK